MVLRLRALPTRQVRVQRVAPVHLLPSSLCVRRAEECQRHLAVSVLPHVRVHRDVFPRDIHHPVPLLARRRYERYSPRHPRHPLAPREPRPHNDHVHLRVPSRRASYRRGDKLDMRFGEGADTTDDSPDRSRFVL